MTEPEKPKSIKPKQPLKLNDEQILARMRGEEYKPAKRDEKLLINRILSNKRTPEQDIALAAATAKGHNPKSNKLKRKLKEYGKMKDRVNFIQELLNL